MQQVVENLAVQLGLAAIVGQKRLQRRLLVGRRVAHPQRQLAQLVAVLGQQVRLQVEHDLQPVLDLPQEGVVLFEDRPLQVRQAADPLQLRQRFQRVAGAQLGQVAAVEQLEELDDELDVADAAAAGLHVAGAAADVERLLLDPPLQGLDAADVGVAQVAAIDPRRRAIRETPCPATRSPATGRALMYACRSQVRPRLS